MYHRDGLWGNYVIYGPSRIDAELNYSLSLHNL